MLGTYFGGRKLRDVHPRDIEGFRRWRRTKTTTRLGGPPKPGTINRDLTRLQGLFTWAKGEELLPPEAENPVSAKNVKREPEPWRPWIILTPEQERAMYALLPEQERLKVVLIKNLGVRLGVLITDKKGTGLRWEQVDWVAGLIHYTSKGHSDVIPMNDAVKGALQALGPKTSGPIFDLSAKSLRRWWKKVRVALGLPGLRMHDLRVTFARQLAEEGVSLKTIQQLLGHTTPTMTLRYIPSSLADRCHAVAALDERNRREARRGANEPSCK